MWIDIHAHLAGFPPNRLQSELAEMQRCDVSLIINSATNLDTSREALDQARNCERMYSTAGISPFDVTGLENGWPDRLAAFLNEPRVIGVGEIGIDTTNPRYPSPDLQLPVFERQLDLAAEYSLPAIIHSRGAEETAARLCEKHGVEKAVFHCFTGSDVALRMVLDRGYYVSFSGIVTFRNADCAGTVIATPLNRIFIETDTPYLAPVPFRGKKNRPAWVSCTGKKVAELHGVSPEHLAASVQDNFRRLFSVQPAPGYRNP
ncbi:MAG: YchF/TatD family DNA exonuclease [Chitinivibrionales bacterium]|nr:YchF/TatD family DNA exonuclease [Chitinivibrionales bacterium]